MNTDKLNALERFVRNFEKQYTTETVREIHHRLDQIQKMSGNYDPLRAGLAAALACCAFVFLLGGGPVEMVCCFVGAGIGNWLRGIMIRRSWTLLACIGVSVAVACLAYFLVFRGLEMSLGIAARHEAGYIGAMLFVIPGFSVHHEYVRYFEARYAVRDGAPAVCLDDYDCRITGRLVSRDDCALAP